MKIKSQEISENFLSSNLKSIYFIYGPNSGLVNKIYKKIIDVFEIEENNPFSTTKISSEDLLNRKINLLDEINTISAFCEYKNILIDIRNTREYSNIKSILNEAIETKISKIRIIIIAGQLKSSDKLIQFYNKCEDSFCIGCYDEEKFLNEKKLQEYLVKKNIILSQKELKKLSFYFSKNTSINENIFKKLDLLKNNQNLDYDKIKDLIGTNDQVDINNLVNGILIVEHPHTFEELEKCRITKTSTIIILKLLYEKLKQIEEIKKIMVNNTSFEKALTKVKFNIFFKDKKIFLEQVKIWDFESIYTCQRRIFLTDIECRKSQELEYILLENLILFIKIQMKKNYFKSFKKLSN